MLLWTSSFCFCLLLNPIFLELCTFEQFVDFLLCDVLELIGLRSVDKFIDIDLTGGGSKVVEGKVADEKSKDDDHKGDVVVELEAVAEGNECDFEDDEDDEKDLGRCFIYQL